MTQNTATQIPLAEVTSQLFASNDDTSFRLVVGELTMPVKLMDCREKQESAGPDSTRTPFLVIFRADVDETHLLQQTLEFNGSIHGLEGGTVDGLLIHRMLRPVAMPEGAYYQVIFN